MTGTLVVLTICRERNVLTIPGSLRIIDVTGSSLELAALTKLYGATVAVDAIDLKIPGGSYCCLLGPSGCGKTSTLRMIAGHEAASSRRHRHRR